MRAAQQLIVAVIAFGLVAVAGCSGDSNPLGSMGGDMLGRVAGDMLTGQAEKESQQQQQQMQAQQASAMQQPAQPDPTAYRPPAQDLTGTLTEKKVAGGSSNGWTFTPEGSTVGMGVDVTKVESDARALAGKEVVLTGRYDTMGTGGFVAEKLPAFTDQ